MRLESSGPLLKVNSLEGILMAKAAVHVRDQKVEVDINEVSRFVLDADEAMELGIKLLRAAYAAKARGVKK